MTDDITSHRHTGQRVTMPVLDSKAAIHERVLHVTSRANRLGTTSVAVRRELVAPKIL